MADALDASIEAGVPGNEAREEPIAMVHPAGMPRKRFYRQRAHCNPFSDHKIDFPISPAEMDWSPYFPTTDRKVTIVDVGCGYVALAPLFPNTHILGMEIRLKLVNYVSGRISALRAANPARFENISVIRTNAMKCMAHFFEKAQLEKMFFLFPDPHFKKKKHKARIITHSLLSEYAYYLQPGGRLYIATDVPDLFAWMSAHLDAHPLFRAFPNMDDPLVHVILSKTEEGIKVARNNGQKFAAVYERILHPSLLMEHFPK